MGRDEDHGPRHPVVGLEPHCPVGRGLGDVVEIGDDARGSGAGTARRQRQMSRHQWVVEIVRVEFETLAAANCRREPFELLEAHADARPAERLQGALHAFGEHEPFDVAGLAAGAAQQRGVWTPPPPEYGAPESLDQEPFAVPLPGPHDLERARDCYDVAAETARAERKAKEPEGNPDHVGRLPHLIRAAVGSARRWYQSRSRTDVRFVRAPA